MNACGPSAPATSDWPTISPASLIAFATLLRPPRVPRSVIPPAVKRKAWVSPDGSADRPTTAASRLRPHASLSLPSVPISVITPLR